VGIMSKRGGKSKHKNGTKIEVILGEMEREEGGAQPKTKTQETRAHYTKLGGYRRKATSLNVAKKKKKTRSSAEAPGSKIQCREDEESSSRMKTENPRRESWIAEKSCL